MCKETCGNNKHNTAEEYNAGKYNPLNWPIRARKWCNSLDRIEHFTFWVAIFTGLLFIVAVLQYRAYVESESAFLIITEPKFIPSGEPTAGPVIIVMAIKNTGKHAAIVEEINISALPTTPEKFPDNPEYQKLIDTAVIQPIAPGLEFPLNFRGAPRIIFSPEIVSNMLSGNEAFYVYGFIKYNSGYNIIWLSETGFCYVYIPPSNRAGFLFETYKKPKYTYAR